MCTLIRVCKCGSGFMLHLCFRGCTPWLFRGHFHTSHAITHIP